MVENGLPRHLLSFIFGIWLLQAKIHFSIKYTGVLMNRGLENFQKYNKRLDRILRKAYNNVKAMEKACYHKAQNCNVHRTTLLL